VGENCNGPPELAQKENGLLFYTTKPDGSAIILSYMYVCTSQQKVFRTNTKSLFPKAVKIRMQCLKFQLTITLGIDLEQSSC
jgi:hypothetical protein